MRIAPSTDFSASRLWGSVRVGVARSAKERRENEKGALATLIASGPQFNTSSFRLKTEAASFLKNVFLLALGNHADLDLRGHVAMDFDRHGHLTERLQRISKDNLSTI